MPKANRSRNVAKTSIVTFNEENVARPVVEQERTGSAEVNGELAKTSTYRDVP